MQKFLDDLVALWMPSHPFNSEHYQKAHYVVLWLIFMGAIWTRFWGLGATALQGDEQTVALAVHRILVDGSPRLPSGLLYLQGLGQLYLMAGFAALLGESEWVLRLPSALCGLLSIYLTFLAGRRFLRPHWNLALTATVAFLPEFIAYSQAARGPIFVVASVAALLALTFAWERTGKPRYPLIAIMVILVGIHFHPAMLFSSLLLFFPSVVRADLREFKQAAAALAVVVIGYFCIEGLIQYPSPDADIPLRFSPGSISSLYPQGVLQALIAAVVIAGLVWIAVHKLQSKSLMWTCALLLAAGLFAQLFLFYHLALILLLAGAIPALRQDNRLVIPLAAIAAAAGCLLIAHLFALDGMGIQTPHDIATAITGIPSIGPYIQAGQFSVVALTVAGVGFLLALWGICHRQRIDDHWVLFVLGSILPLMVMGTLYWNVPTPYASVVVLPYSLCACATLQNGIAKLAPVYGPQFAHRASLAVAAVSGILICAYSLAV